MSVSPKATRPGTSALRDVADKALHERALPMREILEKTGLAYGKTSRRATREQRAAAIEWLDRTGPYAHWAPFTHDSAEHRDTIKAMLAQPRMPDIDTIPTSVMIDMWRAGLGITATDARIRAMMSVLYAYTAANRCGKAWTHVSTPAAREPAPPAQVSQGQSDPVLPARPTPGSLKAMLKAWDHSGSNMQPVYEALHAHLSFKPGKIREIDVWHVEWSDGCIPHLDDPYLSLEHAEKSAARRRMADPGQCVRVTGPHKQIVPV